jgi:ABC-2 type transport system permease protein
MNAFALTVGTLAQRELVRFFRQRTRLIGALGQPVLFWLLFGAGLHGSFQPPAWAVDRPTLSYQEYFFPGVAVLIVLFTAIFSTISIIEDRREGFLQSVLVAPCSPLAIVLGKVVGGASLSVIQAGLFLALAPLMGLWFGPVQFAAMLAFLAVVAFALTGLGFLIAWPLDSTQGYHAVMSIFLMPMWLVSGAFFPGEQSGWLRWVIAVNPLTYGVAGLRRLMYWGDDLPANVSFPSFLACVAATLVFAAVCIAGSVVQTLRRSAKDSR